MRVGKKSIIFHCAVLISGVFFLPQVMAASVCDFPNKKHYIQSIETNGSYDNFINIYTSEDPLGKVNLLPSAFYYKADSPEGKAMLPVIINAMNMTYPAWFWCDGGYQFKTMRAVKINNIWR